MNLDELLTIAGLDESYTLSRIVYPDLTESYFLTKKDKTIYIHKATIAECLLNKEDYNSIIISKIKTYCKELE